MDPHHQQQGSSTDEEDCLVEDDATIAGPTSRSGKRRQQSGIVNQTAQKMQANQQVQQPAVVQSKKLVFSPKKASLRSSQYRPAQNNINEHPAKIDDALFARVNKWVNESRGAHHKSRQQRIQEAVSAQDEAMKYWRMVNLPFEVKWISEKKKAQAPPDPMQQPTPEEKLTSVEKERATNSNQHNSHLPTPEILAAQLDKQKLHTDESHRQHATRQKQRQVFSPAQQIPALDFNNYDGGDLENHADVGRRARVYGRSDYDENFRAQQYELVSPDPQYHHMQNHNLRIDGILSGIRETRKIRKKIKSDSERILRHIQKADSERAERINYRPMSLNTPELYAAPPPSAYFDPVRRNAKFADEQFPVSARFASNHANSHVPLNSARFSAPPLPYRQSAQNFAATENVISAAVTGRKSPFFTAAPNQRNPVSFNLPANSQQLLSTIKQNYPLLLNLAQQVLQIASIGNELKKCVRERRTKLLHELGTTGRNLKEYLTKLEDLRELLESPECMSLHHQGVKNQGHGTGQSSVLNQIRLLQQVFEK
uniref:Uncharacterized protein n=1 Tax=Ditylenchus dipsaci TaxID=166011 RepID=A0A915DYM3_9BILA